MNGKDWKFFGAVWISLLITIIVILVVLSLRSNH